MSSPSDETQTTDPKPSPAYATTPPSPRRLARMWAFVNKHRDSGNLIATVVMAVAAVVTIVIGSITYREGSREKRIKSAVENVTKGGGSAEELARFGSDALPDIISAIAPANPGALKANEVLAHAILEITVSEEDHKTLILAKTRMIAEEMRRQVDAAKEVPDTNEYRDRLNEYQDRLESLGRLGTCLNRAVKREPPEWQDAVGDVDTYFPGFKVLLECPAAQ